VSNYVSSGNSVSPRLIRNIPTFRPSTKYSSSRGVVGSQLSRKDWPKAIRVVQLQCFFMWGASCLAGWEAW
jgi:hypothetical protein